MKKTVGIIAPLIDKDQYNVDFNLRLRFNGRELTLAAFYELAKKGFVPEKMNRGISHQEDIPAAGYYLEGLMHQYGYDTILTNRYDPVALQAMAARDPFAVLVSTTMVVTADSLLELFSSIRKAMPDTRIIGGGLLVWKNYLFFQEHFQEQKGSSLLPWMLFHPGNSRMDADILVVAPHGRESLLQVLSEFEKGSGASFDHIPNLCIPGKKGFSFTRREEEQVDYNTDFTRWDLVENLSVKIPIRTSIGCPYRCRFCDFYKLFPSIFLRSGESLSAELKLIRDRLGSDPGIIHVSDDNVFINKRHLDVVCNAMEHSGLRKWIGFMRGGEFTETELDQIVRSGLLMGMIGVESGDPGQLERMNKRQKIEKVKIGIEQLDARGISTLLTFVVGFPGENKQTLMNTAAFLNSLSLQTLSSSYYLFPLAVQPLSDLSDPSVRAEWKLEGHLGKWSHFTMNSDEAARASYDLFREVSNVPYHYPEESNFFNQAMFDVATRRSLFRLRHQLTVKWIEKEPWEKIAPILEAMTQLMDRPVDGIRESLLNDISMSYNPD